MIANRNRDLAMSDLAGGIPALTPYWGGALAEAAATCFENQGHRSGVRMAVEYTASDTHRRGFKVRWDPVTDQTLRCCNDLQEATEYGAVGVAVLLTKELTEFTAIERSRKGTGFDYWLGHQREEVLPFQHAARLEVSGILSGDDADISARVKAKLRQTRRSDGTLPGYVAVVEFGRPEARVVRK